MNEAVSLNASYKRLFRQTRKNAKVRNIEFSMTMEQFAEIVTRSGGKCELAGIEWMKTVDILARVNRGEDRVFRDMRRQR